MVRIKKRYAILFLAALLILPLIPRSVDATITTGTLSPSSASTFMGMPVVFTATGFVASDTYTVTEIESGGNTTILTVVADSDGGFSFTITPDDYGQNAYDINGGVGGGAAVSFSVQNSDIVPYLIPLVLLSVLFGVFRALGKMT